MTKVYLAGPMRGRPDFNYPEFHDATKTLRALGHTVVNPAESFAGDQGLAWETYMAHDLNVILNDVDVVVVLPGWITSVGAKLEVAVALAVGQDVWTFHPHLDTKPVPMAADERRTARWVVGLGRP